MFSGRGPPGRDHPLEPDLASQLQQSFTANLSSSSHDEEPPGRRVECFRGRPSPEAVRSQRVRVSAWRPRAASGHPALGRAILDRGQGRPRFDRARGS